MAQQQKFMEHRHHIKPEMFLLNTYNSCNKLTFLPPIKTWANRSSAISELVEDKTIIISSAEQDV